MRYGEGSGSSVCRTGYADPGAHGNACSDADAGAHAYAEDPALQYERQAIDGG